VRRSSRYLDGLVELPACSPSVSKAPKDRRGEERRGE
jgi:hypothetical protein